MVSVLNSGSRGPGSSPGRGHCVVLCCVVFLFFTNFGNCC